MACRACAVQLGCALAKCCFNVLLAALKCYVGLVLFPADPQGKAFLEDQGRGPWGWQGCCWDQHWLRDP